MTRALVWKELREQWPAWLALVLVTVGGLAGLNVLPSGRNREEMFVFLLWLSAWGYGVVCGAMLLASEIEEGTQSFLDSLPGTRRRLWRTKAATGLGLLAVQVVIYGVAERLAVQQNLLPFSPAVALVGLGLSGIVGYTMGLYCGSFAKSVVGAIGWATLLCAGAGLLVVPAIVFAAQFAFEWFPNFAFFLRESLSISPNQATGLLPALATVVAVAVAAAVRSRAVYCREDWLRARTGVRRTRAVRPGWGVIRTLAWGQMRGFTVGMVAASAATVVAVVAVRLAAWPVCSLVLGVIGGVTAFAAEQQSGAYRFLADQRLPLGRVWLVKLGLRMAVAGGALVLAVAALIGIAVIRSETAVGTEGFALRNSLQFHLAIGLLTEPVYFFTTWLVYGFAAGSLMGLLIRKPAVACVGAVLVAAPAAALWVPSILNGGALHVWQVFGAPIILLTGTRLLMRYWSTDTLLSRRSLATLGSVVTLAALWMAAALWYRAAEIPAAPDAPDMAAFEAGLPTPEENAGGRLTLVALRRLAQVELEDQERERAEALQLGRNRSNADRPRTLASYSEQALDVTNNGWRAGSSDLAQFLDMRFADAWARDLARAAELPAGVLRDPREVTVNLPLTELNACYSAPLLLAARGLQLQDAGNPAAFVDGLRQGLAIAANLRRNTGIVGQGVGGNVETRMAGAAEQWLAQLAGRPDLLRRALAILQHQVDLPPADVEDIRRTELLFLHNSFIDPDRLPNSGLEFDLFAVGPLTSRDLQRIAIRAPWEQERLRRAMDAFVSRDQRLGDRALALAPPGMARVTRPMAKWFDGRESPSPAVRCRTRASLLQVALRLYQAEKGRPARSLAELVPEYVPAVPTDPYDGQPFRYRLSAGEILRWPPDPSAHRTWVAAGGGDKANRDVDPSPQPTRAVAAGQGILWSVGEDLQDDGGKAQKGTIATDRGQHGLDVIFLVPLPPPPR